MSQMTRVRHIHTNIFSHRLLNFMMIPLFHLLNITLATKRGKWRSYVRLVSHWWKAKNQIYEKFIYIKYYLSTGPKLLLFGHYEFPWMKNPSYWISALSPILLYKRESVILKHRWVLQKVLLLTFLGEGECAGRRGDWERTEMSPFLQEGWQVKDGR